MADRSKQSAEQVDTCRIEQVDGTPVRVQGDGEWTDQDREAFTEVVRAARRKHRNDNCLGGSGCDGTSHSLPCNNAYFGGRSDG